MNTPIQPSGNPAMSPAVQAAIARRQGGGQPGGMQQGQGALTQASAGAPMQNPVPQQPPADAMNKSSAPQVAAPQAYKPQNQEDMIVEALIEQLHNSNKLKSDQLKMANAKPIVQPTMGTPPAAQLPQGQGGGWNGTDGGWGVGGGSQPGMSGVNNPNFLKPINQTSGTNQIFDFNTPSMATSQQQNRFPFR